VKAGDMRRNSLPHLARAILRNSPHHAGSRRRRAPPGRPCFAGVGTARGWTVKAAGKIGFLALLFSNFVLGLCDTVLVTSRRNQPFVGQSLPDGKHSASPQNTAPPPPPDLATKTPQGNGTLAERSSSLPADSLPHGVRYAASTIPGRGRASLFRPGNGALRRHAGNVFSSPSADEAICTDRNSQRIYPISQSNDDSEKKLVVRTSAFNRCAEACRCGSAGDAIAGRAALTSPKTCQRRFIRCSSREKLRISSSLSKPNRRRPCRPTANGRVHPAAKSLRHVGAGAGE